MKVQNLRFSQITLLLGDLVLLNAGFFLAGVLRFQEIQLQNTEYYDYYVQLGVFLNLLWLLLSLIFKTYNTGISLEPRKSVGKSLNIFFWHLFLLLLLLVSLKKDEYSRLFLTYFYLFSAASILPWHFFYLRFLKLLRKRNSRFTRALLIGDEQRLEAFKNTLQNQPELGIKVAANYSKMNEIPSISELKTVCSSKKIEEMYVAFPAGDERHNALFYFCDEQGIRFRSLPDLGVQHSKSLQIDFYGDVPVLSFRSEPLEALHNKIIKRAFDIFGALIVFVVIYPWLIPLLAIVVKFSGKGAVFFKQERTGYKNQSFTIYKFRTMRENEEANEEQALDDDGRLTRIGKFFRKHHLDELPQFWNVLRGDMSLVGPRPHMLSHTKEYQNIIQQYMVRHFVKPGITGLAQVNGLKGFHNIQEMEDRVKTDVYYLENWSFLLDVSIIARTKLIVFFGLKKA